MLCESEIADRQYDDVLYKARSRSEVLAMRLVVMRGALVGVRYLEVIGHIFRGRLVDMCRCIDVLVKAVLL